MRTTAAAFAAGLVVVAAAGADASAVSPFPGARTTLAGLESGIADVALAARSDGVAAAVQKARWAGLETSGTRAEVIVRTEPGLGSLARAALAAHGGPPWSGHTAPS